VQKWQQQKISGNPINQSVSEKSIKVLPCKARQFNDDYLQTILRGSKREHYEYSNQPLIPSRNWLPSSMYEPISTKMSLIFCLAWPNIFSGAVGDWRPFASRRPRDTGPVGVSMSTPRLTTPDIAGTQSAWREQQNDWNVTKLNAISHHHTLHKTYRW